MKQAKEHTFLLHKEVYHQNVCLSTRLLSVFLERLLFCCYGFQVCKLGVIQLLIGTVFS